MDYKVELCGVSLRYIHSPSFLCSHSWRVIIKSDETLRLRACHYGYLPENFHSLEELLESDIESLLIAILRNTEHVLLTHSFTQTNYVYHFCPSSQTEIISYVDTFVRIS